MKTKLLLAGALLLAVAAGFFFARRTVDSGAVRSPSKPKPSAERGTAAGASRTVTAARKSAVDPSKPAVPAPLTPLLALLERTLAALADGPNPAALEELKRELLAADPAEALAAILEFLIGGGDAVTGEEFTLGEKGSLASAPTLRVLLLDLLGQFARTTQSDAAAKFSRALLETRTSADEWALALRNVAWHQPAAKPYLAGKVREMLAHGPWRARPTPGMLEAFDVIVFTRDTAFVPELAEEQRSGSRELQYAAAIALDRLAEQGPLEVMTYLNTHPTELADRPLLRADYYAKADLGQLAQRAALEVYLGRPDVQLDEKGKLLKGLATPATFVSENLLTEPPPPDDGTARRDALARATAEWLAANRFPDLRLPLEQLQRRLAP